MRATTGTTPEGTTEGSSLGNRRAIIKRDSARQSSNSPIAKSSWGSNEALTAAVLPLGSKRDRTFSQVLSGRSTLSEKRQILFHPSGEDKSSM